MTSDRSGELLERSRPLDELAHALAAVEGATRGRMLLVEGEAGAGKTALLRHFCGDARARLLWGGCDALRTPTPLGPLLDVAQATGGELAEVVEGGALPHVVAAALMAELAKRSPTLLVIEDVHWADEATLDVLRILGRRVESVPALVLASFREDELDRVHPLRLLLGELATSRAAARMPVAPLSEAAVTALAEAHGVDGAALHRATGGNPFFVTEALAAGPGEIPPTVRDAVLARAARLSPQARALLEAVAIAPPQAELWLLEALAGHAVDHLEECLTSGMLTARPAAVAFRHELARRALEESLTPYVRVALHRAALAALAERSNDLARLVHHAEGAADGGAVLRFAPAAAARAAALGAHREAAAHYARALEHAERMPEDQRAELLELRAYECQLTHQFDAAIEARERAIECHRAREDARREGDSLRALSFLLWYVGRHEEGDAAAWRAVELLEPLGPSRELARAYSNISGLCMNAEDADAVATWAPRAMALAEEVGATDVAAHSLSDVGTMELLLGDQAGAPKLERVLELARSDGHEALEARTVTNIAWAAARNRDYPVADRWFEEGTRFTAERDLDTWRLCLVAMDAHSHLAQGRWESASTLATSVVRDPRTAAVGHIFALVTLGLLRARRGDPHVWAPLDEALALAAPTGQLQWIAPVAAARAEAHWLAGDTAAIDEATSAALDLAQRRRAPWLYGELACWRRRAGIDEPLPDRLPEPHALELAGQHERAAAAWERIGCAYDAALARAGADDEATLRRALDALHALEVRGAAALVARRLRERGARGLPRGPRRATLANPASLTARELEVLTLLTGALRNAEIAERLFLSEKTVAHHVSAILRKLGAATRAEASAEAVRRGL